MNLVWINGVEGGYWKDESNTDAPYKACVFERVDGRYGVEVWRRSSGGAPKEWMLFDWVEESAVFDNFEDAKAYAFTAAKMEAA